MNACWLAAVRPLSDRLPVILGLVIAVMAVGDPKAAYAQTAPAAPVRENIDANGVDLFAGKLTLTGPALVLGSEGNTLSYYRWNQGSGWSDSVVGLMNLSDAVMSVGVGAVRDGFTVWESTYS